MNNHLKTFKQIYDNNWDLINNKFFYLKYTVFELYLLNLKQEESFILELI